MKQEKAISIQTPKPEDRENNEASSSATSPVPCGAPVNIINSVRHKIYYIHKLLPVAKAELEKVRQVVGYSPWVLCRLVSKVEELLNQCESDERIATQQKLGQGTEPLSQNLLKSNKLGDVADLLKDFQQELEKEAMKFSKRITNNLNAENWPTTIAREFIFKWCITPLLTEIEKLQKDNEAEMESVRIWRNGAEHFRHLYNELLEKNHELQQENEKRAMDFAIWISGYENLSQAKKFWHCETTVELYNLFKNNTLKQKAS